MLAAGVDILGLKVPETNPVFLAALSIHVLAALLCIVAGAAAALSAKGSPRHIRSGRIYYWSLSVVFATATTLAAMRWAEDYHLFIIGSIAFTAASVGYLHRRRRRPGDAGHITAMGASYIALLTAFYVDNGKNLPLWSHLPHLAYWCFPPSAACPSSHAHSRAPAARRSVRPSQSGKITSAEPSGTAHPRSTSRYAGPST